MDTSPNHAEKLQIAFFNYLKNKNLKHTTERNAICSTVCRTKDPFTTETIRQQLEDVNFHVSRASVYNTMELLLEANIVVRHQFNSSIAHYELKYIATQTAELWRKSATECRLLLSRGYRSYACNSAATAAEAIRLIH